MNELNGLQCTGRGTCTCGICFCDTDRTTVSDLYSDTVCISIVIKGVCKLIITQNEVTAVLADAWTCRHMSFKGCTIICLVFEPSLSLCVFKLQAFLHSRYDSGPIYT